MKALARSFGLTPEAQAYAIPLFLIPLWIVVYILLQPAVDAVVFGLMHLTPQLMLTEAVRFFLYEVPKVMLLLTLIVFGVGIVWNKQNFYGGVRSFSNSPKDVRSALSI